MRIRAAAAALVMATAVVACSSDPAPSPLPTLPTSSPTPSPLSVPAEALAETPHGAAAFTRYFFDQVNRAYVARDATVVQRLSTSACGSCAAVVGDIQRLRREGHQVAGQRYKLTFSEAAPADSEGRMIVDFGFTADPYVERDSSSAIVKEFPEKGPQEGQTMLVRVDDQWRVAAVRLVTA
ncbi:MAG: DUF6318 family protein [Mycobacteriales bacterium]